MRTCLNCNTFLLKNAKFCHVCGTKAEEPVFDCPSCRTSNPKTAKFCISCGNNFKNKEQESTIYDGKYKLDFSNTKYLHNEIRQHFIDYLREGIEAEQNPKKYSEYLEAFYHPSFRDSFEKKAKQLAEEAFTIHSGPSKNVSAEIDFLLNKNFDNLYELFIIKYCPHLNEVKLPEAILKYQDLRRGEFDLEDMIFDFLNLEDESESYYFDFITMPEAKLKNAVKSFLFPAGKKEKILVICDQTVFGSCKEGFGITDTGLYWKAHFNKPKYIHFDKIEDVKREGDWLSINSAYFHVSKSVNLKLLKLLKKLKSIM